MDESEPTEISSPNVTKTSVSPAPSTSGNSNYVGTTAYSDSSKGTDISLRKDGSVDGSKNVISSDYSTTSAFATTDYDTLVNYQQKNEAATRNRVIEKQHFENFVENASEKEIRTQIVRNQDNIEYLTEYVNNSDAETDVSQAVARIKELSEQNARLEKIIIEDPVKKTTTGETTIRVEVGDSEKKAKEIQEQYKEQLSELYYKMNDESITDEEREIYHTQYKAVKDKSEKIDDYISKFTTNDKSSRERRLEMLKNEIEDLYKGLSLPTLPEYRMDELKRSLSEKIKEYNDLKNSINL